MATFDNLSQGGGAGRGRLRDFIGLPKCPSRKSTNRPLRSMKKLFTIYFFHLIMTAMGWPNNARRPTGHTQDGLPMPGYTPDDLNRISQAEILQLR